MMRTMSAALRQNHVGGERETRPQDICIKWLSRTFLVMSLKILKSENYEVGVVDPGLEAAMVYYHFLVGAEDWMFIEICEHENHDSV